VVSAGVSPSVDEISFLQVEGPIAEGKAKFLGCAYSTAQATGFQNYWNQVTPENGGKWGSVEGTRNVMNWGSLDAAYNFAKKYGMPFKEHTLIWGAQQPAWMASLDTTSQRKEIEQWFSLLAARYPDIAYIDVVNEPLHNAPNGMTPWGSTTKNIDYAKALGGAGTSGWDWIIKSFRMARKYFPKSKLIMNEYSVINSTTETQKYIKIINLLKADSLIDGIGEQAHAFTTAGATSATLKANLDALAATGVPIYLTEMDIDGLTDLAQLKEMQRVFTLFWEHPGVKGITMWGFRVGLWRNDQGAYLINQSGTERPALKWLRAYVGETLVKTESISVMANDSSTTIKKLGGTLNMVAKVLPENTTIPNVTWTVSPSYRATIDSKGLLTAVTTGTVFVTATAWDGSGVKGSTAITITNDATGIEDQKLSEKVKVYPNPAVNGSFSITGIESIKQIDLVNLLGEKVKTFSNLDQSTLTIQADVPAGVYMLHLYDGKNTAFGKIIIPQ
jgi:endo-1,4-beta-xylanase